MTPIHRVRHWRIILAGGGTGGHVVPGLAIAEEVLARDPYAEITFVGAEGGIEEKLVPTFGHKLVRTGARRPGGEGGPLRLARLAWGILRSRSECIKLFREQHPHVVVGLGGFASTGPLLAARNLGLPTVLMEQNAIPGRANRFLARHVDGIITQFEESVPYFGAHANVEVLGNPVLQSTLEDGGSRILSNGPVMLVMGGSQGARALNTMLTKALPQLRTAVPALEVIALTGEADAEDVRARMRRESVRGRAIPFSVRMGNLYSYADLVVARAGATTIAELTALGLPSVLVPYPYAADNHQEANARILERAGAAEVIRQEDLTPDAFVECLEELLTDPQRLMRMSLAARKLGVPDAARRAVDHIDRLRDDVTRKSA